MKDHPDVYDAVVVGAPDDRWGEHVVAVVAVRPSRHLTLAELRDHCRASLASYKLPRALCIVDVIPRGPTGKADYRWARGRVLRARR